MTRTEQDTIGSVNRASARRGNKIPARQVIHNAAITIYVRRHLRWLKTTSSEGPTTAPHGQVRTTRIAQDK